MKDGDTLMIIWLMFFPFLISVGLAIFGNRLDRRVKTLLTTGMMASILMALLLNLPNLDADTAQILPVYDWVPAMGLSVSLYLDGLAVLFGLIVSGIGAVIFIYTHFYFEEDDEHTRFSVWLSAFSGAMLWLVLAGNLLFMFVMWELTSITSFMLIGFYGKTDPNARASATRALVVTGGGGLALLGGILLLGYVNHQVNGVISFDYATLLQLSQLDAHPLYGAILLLIGLGAMTKSAQFPFHFWLPNAMTAPAPASAFLHSATMVKAGVYLLARLYPLLHHHPLWEVGLQVVGLTTFLVSAVLAIKQRDLKGLLAYSTTAWLGVLVALLAVPHQAGMTAFVMGTLAHAFYKSILFLCVGTIDHSCGTRQVDELGGLFRRMPLTGSLAIISALSMAGIPPLYGFVAKENLLHVVTHDWNAWALAVVFVGSALLVMVAWRLIWEVFFRPSDVEIHYHAMPRWTMFAPSLLAIGGSIGMVAVLNPATQRFVNLLTGESNALYLIPKGGFANTEFQLSLAIIALGTILFAVRRWLVWEWSVLPFTGAQLYQAFIALLSRLGEGALWIQGGKVRYYLVVILAIYSALLAYFVPTTLYSTQALMQADFQVDFAGWINLALLLIGVASVWFSIINKRHILSALSLGLFGYVIGGVFILEGAPDVALVQFLVETLASVLLIIMISRLPHSLRKHIGDNLWKTSRRGIIRDAVIASVIGVMVFLFAFAAISNRPNRERDTIANWYFEHTQEDLGIQDVVAAVVTDYRGMDTLIEITVFAVAGLGILSLLTLSREQEGYGTVELTQRAIPLTTPFVRVVATLIFPFTILIAGSQLLYGGGITGDGFTAGVVAGLSVALGYIVYGYYAMQNEFSWLRPIRFLIAGLSLAFTNAALPLLFGKNWMAFMEIEGFYFAGIHPATTLLFETSIALTVVGSVGLILDTIAHPADVHALGEDRSQDHEVDLPNKLIHPFEDTF